MTDENSHLAPCRYLKEPIPENFDAAGLPATARGPFTGAGGGAEPARPGQPPRPDQLICTSVGGNAELVVEGQTGYLVPVGDVARIAAALTQILSDPIRARRWGEAARRRALELFPPVAMIERHQHLYELLAE